MKIVVATKNKGKIKEFNELLSSLNIEVVSIDYEDVEETGKTFNENSLLKAKAVKKLTKYAVLSDDSGMCIEALDNFPGVYSARVFPECNDFNCKCLKILEKMNNISNRNAIFVSSITLILQDGKVYQFEGIAKGKIETELKGKNGHGYDPIFYSNELGKTFAEATTYEKNKFSHRGKAFAKLKEFLENNLK